MKTKTLRECLNHIQVHLNAPKNRVNTFQNYKYRNLDDIFEGLKPLLKETGCVVTCSDGVEVIGDRIYVKSLVTISKADEHESCIGWAREPEMKKGNDVAQITGTSSSYARKYALSGLFAIDDCQDIDSMDNRPYEKTDAEKGEFDTLVHEQYFVGKIKDMQTRFKDANSKHDVRKLLDDMIKCVNHGNNKPKGDSLVVNDDGTMGYKETAGDVK